MKDLSRIGFDAVAGYLDGGLERASDFPEALGWVDRVDAHSIAERLASSDPPLLLDVRNPTEWEQGRIERAVDVPLSRLTERLVSLPRYRRIIIYCATGYRSAIAARLLRREGWSHVGRVAGRYAELATLAGAASREGR